MRSKPPLPILLLTATAAATLLLGCGAADTGSGGDNPPDDTSGADAGADGTADTVADTLVADTVVADTVVADTVVADTGKDSVADTAVGACTGDAPNCASACGSDAFHPPAICKDAAWFCEKGVIPSDCPKGTCWGAPDTGEVCKDGKWTCDLGDDVLAKCPAVACGTCSGVAQPVDKDDCVCTCTSGQVTCSKKAPTCNGEAPDCVQFCGSDYGLGAATCVGVQWQCSKGVVKSDCPADTCWGPAMEGNVCEQGKWVCKPDKGDYAKCPADMCLTCDGFGGPVPEGTCTCSCQGGKVACITAKSQCGAGGASNLGGVSIAFPAGPCTATLAQAAAGLVIPYQIVIQSDVHDVVALPMDAGQCGQPDQSGLIPFPQIEGGGQKWCVCDTGLCMGPDTKPKLLVAGTFDASFKWDGVNWFGPSDTGNPKGSAFPVGGYTVTVKVKGYRDDAGKGKVPFEVVGTRTLVLVP